MRGDGEERLEQGVVAAGGGDKLFRVARSMGANTDACLPSFEDGGLFDHPRIFGAHLLLRCDRIAAVDPDKGLADGTAPLFEGGQRRETEGSRCRKIGEGDGERGSDVGAAIGLYEAERPLFELAFFGLFEVSVGRF